MNYEIDQKKKKRKRNSLAINFKKKSQSNNVVFREAYSRDRYNQSDNRTINIESIRLT